MAAVDVLKISTKRDGIGRKRKNKGKKQKRWKKRIEKERKTEKDA